MLNFYEINHVTNWIIALTLAMARIYPCLFLIPLFSFHELKGIIRYAIVIVVALIVTPGIQAALPSDHSWYTLMGLYFKETLLGLLIGVLLSMPFWLFESVGGLFDNQRGALMGGQLNPSLGMDFTPLGFLFKQTLIMIIVTSGSFIGLIEMIWNTYLIWPPTQWLPIPSPDGFHIYLKHLSETFDDMILYAAPLIGLLLFIEFGMALMSLYSPQLQVYVLSMPVKCLAGMMFLVLYIPTLFYLAGRDHLNWDALNHIFPLLLKITSPHAI